MCLQHIPELQALHEGLDKIAETSNNCPRAVARVWIVLHGVRNPAGVRWASEFVVGHFAVFSADKLLPCAQELLSGYFDKAAQHPACRADWASHAEGRNSMLSRKWFLEAFATPDGATKMEHATVAMHDVLADALAGAPDECATMDPHALLIVAAAVRKVLL